MMNTDAHVSKKGKTLPHNKTFVYRGRLLWSWILGQTNAKKKYTKRASYLTYFSYRLCKDNIIIHILEDGNPAIHRMRDRIQWLCILLSMSYVYGEHINDNVTAYVSPFHIESNVQCDQWLSCQHSCLGWTSESSCTNLVQNILPCSDKPFISKISDKLYTKMHIRLALKIYMSHHNVLE
jgi:hypothetical protein